MGRIIICSTPNIADLSNPEDIYYQGDISTVILLSKIDPENKLDPDSPVITNSEDKEMTDAAAKNMTKCIKARYPHLLQHNSIIISNVRNQFMLLPRYSQTGERISPDVEMFIRGSIEAAPEYLN